ncbi:MarR family winged helix-turn-helix transcriptional regulator [Neolewinella antarctica]|uniref:DNA-binding MarR family transcriptional regulator n=1 Tax=Neolewinella antarctica TaxID=442734 RepID=A0ABX0XCD8_9BACT|nr:MarR family winged helix-turn-helix transcriptional regulator [Neolewinella antarctica]NJC26750.1 DNA-binding MarR family transcriptional regulator [Neolewinella antarctica]
MQNDRLLPLLLRTAHFVRRKQAEVVSAHSNLTLQQFNILRILRAAELEGERALPTMKVASRLTEPGVGITRLVNKLATQRLITLTTDAKDSRVKHCELTNGGRAELDKLSGPIRQLEAEAMRGVDRYAEADMKHALSLMLKNIE